MFSCWCVLFVQNSFVSSFSAFFFFNATATTEIYTLSLHDALPISDPNSNISDKAIMIDVRPQKAGARRLLRSEEHTSELQSLAYLVCRLLLEKKNKIRTHSHPSSNSLSLWML